MFYKQEQIIRELEKNELTICGVTLNKKKFENNVLIQKSVKAFLFCI